MPGFKKDDVQAELKDGYLTINAQTQGESEDKDEQGTYVRKERFSGKCSRTFYVGDDIEEDDIKAKFEDGTLKIDVPKKQEQPKLEEKKTISIEGMMCQHCVAHVTKALTEVPGVTSVNVSLEHKNAVVTGSADDKALTDAVTDAGYKVKKIV